ncbi:uncharacterized protein [Asterias amurensis]|uniref:uncharacterized protein isoform X2 n=1 Tax=Asterias amurensis TaxID=7602 RepID=UPI003AB3835E
MGRLKNFFFGSSHGHHKYSKNPPQQTATDSPSTSAEAEPSSSSQSQSPATTSPPTKHNSRLRRSLSMKKLRSSFRRKDHAHVPAASKPHQWQQDEKSVRAGSCNFAVKYLGSIEVTESRGMHICEDAAKQLRASAKKKVRAILWVSSDGLRVVDEDNKGLIVDQTIEKVSFCAPDRHNDKGFSYICRDGTTRRWLCHCFHSLREPGERLSHAVGCAFAACLERKQQRDKLCGVKVEFDVNKTSFTRQGSFRQATMTEQMEAAAAEEAEVEGEKENQEFPVEKPALPYAMPRRHATDAMLARQGSFRGFPGLHTQSPFKRQLSLRLNDLPSTLQRQQQVLQTHTETSPASPNPPHSFQQQQQQQQLPPSQQQQQQQQPFRTQQQAVQPAQPISISAACQELSEGLFELSSKESYARSAAAAAAQQPHTIMPPAAVPMAAAVPQPVQASQHHVPHHSMQTHQPMATHQPMVTQQPMASQQVLTQPMHPSVSPIRQTNPWAPPPQPQPPARSGQQAGLNPWDPAPAPQATGPNGISQAEKWLTQTSNTVVTKPFPSPQGSILGPGGETTVQNMQMQNGFNNLTHQQMEIQNMTYQAQPVAGRAPAANYNNSATAPIYISHPQQPAGVAAGNMGISGAWTSDLSRTLPDSTTQGNTNGYSSSFEAKWEALPSNQSTVVANNPFVNVTKAFEIDL